jgi:hypothetical protein
LTRDERYYTQAMGLMFGIFSAASFVLSASLFAFCIPTVLDGNSAGCVPPHQVAGVAFALLALLLLFVALLLVIGPKPRPPGGPAAVPPEPAASPPPLTEAMPP